MSRFRIRIALTLAPTTCLNFLILYAHGREFSQLFFLYFHRSSCVPANNEAQHLSPLAKIPMPNSFYTHMLMCTYIGYIFTVCVRISA